MASASVRCRGKQQASCSSLPQRLFVGPDGPMVFYVPPCSSRQRLRSLIEAGGGAITELPGGDEVLHIFPEGSSVKRLQGRCAVRARFVEQSSEEKQLLSWRNFAVGDLPGPGVGPPEPQPPQVQPVQAAASANAGWHGSKGGRLQYMAEDDAAMAQWVRKNQNLRESGRQIWERAEKAGVTKHTWQSMQNRWRRRAHERKPPIKVALGLCPAPAAGRAPRSSSSSGRERPEDWLGGH